MSTKNRMPLVEAISTFPIGTKVAYQSTKGIPSAVESVVRSEPWEIGFGQVVVKINGQAGGVSVDHLMVLS